MAKNPIAPDIDWQAIERDAENGDVASMVLLGTRAGARRDAALAERWWRAAAAEGHARAMLLLGGLLAEQGRRDDALAFWRKAAAAGERDAGILVVMLEPSSLGPTSFKVKYWNDNGIDVATVQSATKVNRPEKQPSGLGKLFPWIRSLLGMAAAQRDSSPTANQLDDLTLAEIWYEQRGYRIVDRSFRGCHLVVYSEGRFVFCEVQRREESAIGRFPDPPTIETRERIKLEARTWLSQLRPSRLRRLGLTEASSINSRFDLVSVLPHGFEVIEGCY